VSHEPGQATAAETTRNGSAPHEQERDSWTPINLNTLPEHPPVQPTLGSVGLVYPGKRHVFSGPQETAKTLAAYAIGLEVVRQDGDLILIDFEMGAWDARNRLRELGAETNDLDRIHYLEPSDPATDRTMPDLLTLRPTLVIVDAAAGAYDLQGLDDNKRQDVERFTRLYVRAFWKAGVATIVLDHVVKNTETRGKYAVGSERKVGGADVHLGFEVISPISRGSRGLYKIVTHKDRGGFLKRGTLANMELDSDPDTHQITWGFTPAETDNSGAPFRYTLLMEKVSRYLEEVYPGGTSRNQIEKAGLGKSAEQVRHAIDQLIIEDYAAEETGHRGSRLTRITTPYRHETDPKRAETKATNPHEQRTDEVALASQQTTDARTTPSDVQQSQTDTLQTLPLHARPTSSHLVPDEVNPPRPTSSPPYRGRGRGDSDPDDVTSSQWTELFHDTEPDNLPAELKEPT
jgi:hypothetical protein